MRIHTETPFAHEARYSQRIKAVGKPAVPVLVAGAAWHLFFDYTTREIRHKRKRPKTVRMTIANLMLRADEPSTPTPAAGSPRQIYYHLSHAAPCSNDDNFERAIGRHEALHGLLDLLEGSMYPAGNVINSTDTVAYRMEAPTLRKRLANAVRRDAYATMSLKAPPKPKERLLVPAEDACRQAYALGVRNGLSDLHDVADPDADMVAAHYEQGYAEGARMRAAHKAAQAS